MHLVYLGEQNCDQMLRVDDNEPESPNSQTNTELDGGSHTKEKINPCESEGQYASCVLSGLHSGAKRTI